MKNTIFSLLFVGLTILGTACTDDFDNINKDPNKVHDINPGYLLTRMWMRYNGSPHEEHRSNLIMAGPISGVLQCGYRSGQAFDGTNDGYNEAKMAEMYRDAIRNGVQLVTNLAAGNTGQNDAKLAVAKISLQFAFQRVTDLYGDVPYTEAGLGYTEGVFYPKYDSQEYIYKTAVSTLKESRDVLLSTNSEPFNAENDVIFGGIAKDQRNATWASLANSLILRMGLNGVNGDATWSRETVEEAANHAAGFINAAPAILPTGEQGGEWGLIVNGAGFALTKNGHVFVGEEWLRRAQNNRDPRIFYVAAHALNTGGWWTVWDTWMGKKDPLGNDVSMHFDAFAEAARPGEPWKPVTFTPLRGGGTESFSVRGQMIKLKNDNSQERFFGEFVVKTSESDEWNQYHVVAAVNPETIGNTNAPIVVFGADESYYILAEAKQRGWNVPGSVEENLQNAITISLAKYPQLYGSLSDSPKNYLEYQSLTETGDKKTLTYDALSTAYINRILGSTIDLQTIWIERWKSLLTGQGAYEAFTLWNRTNMDLQDGYSSKRIPYPGTEFMKMPVYDEDDIAVENLVFGQEVEPLSYSDQPFHNGGSTEGWRPRRINYPNNERSNNAANVQAASDRQIRENGFTGSGSHFITTYQWYSAKE